MLTSSRPTIRPHTVFPATEQANELGPTELEPPDAGGCGVLFEEIDSRVPGPVLAVTKGRGRAIERRGPADVFGGPIARRWGSLAPRASLHHLRSVARLRRLQRRKGSDSAVQGVARLAADDPYLGYVIVGAGEERGRRPEQRARDGGVARSSFLPARSWR